MTKISSSNSSLNAYFDYIYQQNPDLKSEDFSQLIESLQTTDWSEPNSALELNNFAVMALVEAEQDENLDLRAINLEMALDALIKGVELNEHPLCVAHLALVQCMIGEREEAGQRAFSNFVNALHAAYSSSESLPLGLIYLPTRWANLTIARSEKLQYLLHAKDGHKQALLLLTEVLCQAQLVFYNTTALRFLHVALHLTPNSIFLNLKLGLASLIQKQWEGFLYLQKARELAPDRPQTLQAIYLAYRDPERPETGNFWLETARNYAQHHPQSLSWKWTERAIEDPLTCIPFEGDLLLTVEPNVRSIVTSMLLAEGDWFEAEMELWRSQIQPGMTVIDVGANVGVYTFSAAQRVGATGRVLAVEPFSGCVQCLQETCRVNNLPWVTVCAGAASDRTDTLRLSLKAASELNQVVDTDVVLEDGEFEEIRCFTLDSLIEQEQLNRVDWLKIDAEAHELQVLMGSDRLLSTFAPKILYENTAGINVDDARSSNIAVAEFLLERGYKLFRYQPYLQDLVPIDDLVNLRGNLNIIALPAE